MNDDEAIARIRDADPARGHESDLASLRRAVTARTGLSDGDREAPATPTPEATDELAARRERGRRRTAWFGAAAAALVVGVAGYGLGATRDAATGGDAGGADEAYDLSAAEDAPVQESADGEAEVGSSGGSTLAEDSQYSEDSAGSDSSNLTTSRTVFLGDGLSDEPGSAQAFGYDPTGIASAATVERVAAALGVAGSATEQAGSWTVTDGARTVQVLDDGTASLSYSDADLDPWACAVSGSDTSEPDDLGSCPDQPTPPSDATGTVRELLTEIGVDVEELTFSEQTESGIAWVSASRTGSEPTAPQWTVAVAADGIYSVWGPLAPLTSLGEYDVVSPREGVARLTDPRFGAGMQLYPMAAGGVAVPESGDPDSPVSSDTGEPPGPVTPVQPGEPIPWPVTEVSISGAELTLASYSLPSGAVALLPTWSLTAAGDGGTWTVLAVAEGELELG